MAVTITKKPVVPVIQITKNDDTKYTFNHFTGTYDFRIEYITMEPPLDHVGGTFEMIINSSDASNSEANTLLNNIEEGNEIEVWVGKDDSSKVKVFNGVIETIHSDETTPNHMRLTVNGPDWGSDLLKSKLINQFWIQQKLVDGVTLDGSDDTVLLENIVNDILTELSSYPTSEYTVEDHGLVVDSANISVPSIRLPQFEANFEYLDDKLVELDQIVGTTHYVDPSKNFIMKVADSIVSASGVLLVDDVEDSVAATWDQTKVGLVEPGARITNTVENHKRRIYGLGGDNLVLDQSQETDSTSTKLDSAYLAMRFTPQFRRCNSFGILLSKVGSPAIGPTVELREDFNGEPEGSVLRDSLSKNKDAISTIAGWHYFDINVDLNVKANYWIVIAKVGDASNTFQWHRNSGSSHVNASSAGGISPWTVNTNSYGFAFREYSSVPVLSVMSDFASATAKHFHEQVIKKPDITDLRTMTQLLSVESQKAFKRKQIFSGPIYAPDTPLQAGQIIRIRKNASGRIIDAEFIISAIEFIYEAEADTQTGNFTHNITAYRYLDY